LSQEAGPDKLVVRLRQEDGTAARELVAQYYPKIYAFMRSLGHDQPSSEDLTQETFLRVWKHIAQLRDGNCLVAWLYRIARNVSNRHRTSCKAAISLETDAYDGDTGSEDVLQKVTHNEDLEQVRRAVSRLPEEQRVIIVLHYMHHLSIAETAEAVGLSNIKNKLHGALEALRQELQMKERNP
jgi:RNA polymerase sigma-70 factor (ECF subfamily)